MVTARLRRRQAAPDEIILIEGQPSDTLFIITAGWVKLEGGNVDRAVTLANLGVGSLLGESDLLFNRPYAMTARAAGTTSTQLLTLARTDLEELIHERPSIGLKFSAGLGLRIPFLEQYLTQQRLRNIELLSALSDDDLRAIAQKLEFQSIDRGNLIIQAGSPGDAAYFIEEGHVRLITKSNEGESFEELDEGAIFGNTALTTGKTHTSTARAVSAVNLWVLGRTAYQELITRRPTIKLAFSRALAEGLSIGDQADAVERMRGLQLFADMPTDSLHALAARLVLRHFPLEEAIYTEGTPGDAMYIVESGEVKLMDSAFSDAHLLERLRPGESFGEMALLTGRTRAECARAATDTTLWVLYKSDFDDVMVQYPEISVSLSRAITERLASRENDFVIRHLRRINLFSNLASSELKIIAAKVRGLRFRPGEFICLAGQPAQYFFMIENGEVKRIATEPNGAMTLLGILDSGDSFGEQEIVQGIPYSATAQALSEVELWTISKNDFQQMLEAFPSLTLTITRMMADRLTRAQQVPPQTRVRPHNPPPRPPAPRSGSQTPPPGRRIQPPPSGARPIKPAALKVTESDSQIVRPVTSAPRTPSPALVPPPHKAPASSLGVARQHSAPPLQAPTHTERQTEPHRVTPSLRHPAPRPETRRTHLQGPGFFAEFGTLITGLSLGGKLRALTLVALAVWFFLIVGPFTTVSTVSSAVGGLQLSNNASGGTGAPQDKVASAARGNSAGPAKVAFMVPTNTPVPTRTPAPTFTPRPQPTAVRVLPTRTPAPPPPAAAAAAPAPALPPPEVDPRLVPSSGKSLPHVDQFKLIPASVARGQKFWRITKVAFEDIAESGNDHTIYVMIKDENGKRADAKLKWWGEGSGDLPDQPQKSAEDMCNCNYGLFMYGDGYGIKIVDQYPSDQATGMIMPMKRHVNYRVYYQLTTMP
jgi:CRP-like cAMP-binding protein